MSEVWTRWQGLVVNSTFPLGRYLGSSDHSGVFVTRSAAPGTADVAIKLVPTTRALAEVLLPRWKRAGGLPHPHLLPLLQWGGCQLEGLPYLYALMEYADQTLAQLLAHRAMTEDEAREMLLPVLDALSFLHGQDLVQGQLKPTNILVVGEELKLASDTVRRRGDAAVSTHALSAYDPPEALQGSTSPAGDIWALGVTLYEALARRLPSGLGESGEAVVLPADFPPGFRDMVSRCLSPNPQDRPSLAELAVFARGQPLAPQPAAAVPATLSADSEPASEPALSAAPEAAPRPTPGPTPQPTPEQSPSSLLPAVAPDSLLPPPPPAVPVPAAAPYDASSVAASAPSLVIPDGEAQRPIEEAPPRPRALLALLLGMPVLLALVWVGVRLFAPRHAPAPPPPPAPAAVAPAAPAVVAPTGPGATTRPSASQAATSPVALHEVIPDVPLAARRTVHGHIKVWIRVIVNPDGSVFAATTDRAGSSRYFQRLALDAAGQWTFPPTDAPARRLMQIRFDFSRDGTTGHAVRLP